MTRFAQLILVNTRAMTHSRLCYAKNVYPVPFSPQCLVLNTSIRILWSLIYEDSCTTDFHQTLSPGSSCWPDFCFIGRTITKDLNGLCLSHFHDYAVVVNPPKYSSTSPSPSSTEDILFVTFKRYAFTGTTCCRYSVWKPVVHHDENVVP